MNSLTSFNILIVSKINLVLTMFKLLVINSNNRKTTCKYCKCDNVCQDFSLTQKLAVHTVSRFLLKV